MIDPSRLPPLPFQLKSRDDRLLATFSMGQVHDLNALLVTMIRKASKPHVTYLRKSFASTLRERKLGLHTDERSAIIDLAHQLDVEAAGPLAAVSKWLNISETARLLELKVERVREMLTTEEGRRNLG